MYIITDQIYDAAGNLVQAYDPRLIESQYEYDGRGRPVARTTWLVPLGAVNVEAPPIAGLGTVSASDGLTEQFLYDDNLADSAGLDSSGGLAPVISSFGNVSLAAALTKLTDTQANGGAAISFSSTAPGSARVSISPTGEVSFAIADAAGRSVMSGMLEPPSSSSAGDLITWSCTLHDTTTSLSGFGTVLETRSIDALGNVRKSLSDAAGRTLRSIDALGKITAFTYDPAGNQLSVLDPNAATGTQPNNSPTRRATHQLPVASATGTHHCTFLSPQGDTSLAGAVSHRNPALHPPQPAGRRNTASNGLGPSQLCSSSTADGALCQRRADEPAVPTTWCLPNVQQLQ